MKTFILLISIFASQFAFGRGIKVTSFNFADFKNRIAEICGQADEPFSNTDIVDITIDPTEKAPAYYTAIPSEKGQFCTLVVTFTGKAALKLRGQSVLSSAQTK